MFLAQLPNELVVGAVQGRGQEQHQDIRDSGVAGLGMVCSAEPEGGRKGMGGPWR